MFYILEKEVRREFRDQIQEAQDAGDSAKADALRKERQDLRRQLRKERRERGEAFDQALGRSLSRVWNEDKAQEFVKETLSDLAVDIIEGELTLLEAVDEALVELAEDADELLDFSDIPVVGGIIELVDGPVFNMFIRDSLRPWVESELRKLL